MNVMRKAACAAALMAANLIMIGCGNTFRPVSSPLPVTTGNPAGAESEVVLDQCPCPAGSVVTANGMCMNTTSNKVSSKPSCMNIQTGTVSNSLLTDIDVAGDSNSGNRQLQNEVGCLYLPGGCAADAVSVAVNPPLAFDFSRTSVFTANTANDSVTQLQLGSSGGFAASTKTITLPPGSAPIGISFQYFGSTYTQDYVVNSNAGKNPENCSGKGSLAVIVQATGELKSPVCLGASPVFAWIYWDQTKVFVLDNSENENQVYVVNASSYEVTNHIPVGLAPIKAAQSNTGQYLYVLNSGDGTISVIDGLQETVVPQLLQGGGTAPAVNAVGYAVCGNALCTSPVIDIAQDPNFNDKSSNTQINHIWLLHANGTVSVWDGTVPGQLTWITSLATITAAQAAQTPPAYPTNLALLRDGTYAYVGVGNTDQIVAIDTSKLVNQAITPGVNAVAGPAAFPATTSITVGVHRTISQTLTDVVTNTQVTPQTVTTYTDTVPVEVTTPVVNSVAVSRESNTSGSSADLSKVYATTTTNTIYYCYDYTVTPADCSASVNDPWANGNPIATALPIPAPPVASPYLAAGCIDLAGQNAMSCPNLYNGTSVVTAAAQTNLPINTVVTTIPAPTMVIPCLDAGNPATGEYDGQKNCPATTPVVVLGRS